MNIYAVAFNEDDPKNLDLIKEKWNENEYYEINNSFVFIAPKEETVTSKIANKIGMNEDSDIKGVVIAIEAYNGFNDSGLWEWMKNKEKNNGNH